MADTTTVPNPFAEPNPFDEFDGPEAVPASEGLQPGPDPSLWQSFKENLVPMVGGLATKPRNIIDARTIERSETQGVAQPGDSPFAGLVSQAEADQARQRLDKAKRDREAYESFHSDTVAGKAAGLVGGLLGGLADPTIAVGGVGVAGRVATGLERAGASGVLSRILGTGLEAGGINAVIDVASQGADISSGLQKEPYSPLQTAGAFAVGGAFGFGMHGIAEGVGHVLATRNAAKAAETARVDQYMGVRDFERTGGQPADITVGGPAVRQPPEVEAIQQATARAVETIPDAEFKKIADGAAAADIRPDLTERVSVPVSTEEAAILKRAGVDVDENGTMPGSAVETILQERDRRANEAESPTGSYESSLNRDASWVVRNKETGEVVLETFDKKVVDALNTAKYEAVGIRDYLGSINGKERVANDTGIPRDATVAEPQAAPPKLPRPYLDAVYIGDNADGLAVFERRNGNRVLREANGKPRPEGETRDAINRGEFEVAAPRAAEPQQAAALKAQPLRAQPMADNLGGSAVPARTSADSRFPARRELPGEVDKPRSLPADATPAEVQAFRITDAMRDIAGRLNRKLEVDRRFTAKGALGEYKPKEGVLRIRQEGDFEVFSHELGHALDQELGRGPSAPGWKEIQNRHADELRALDTNTTNPAEQTVAEGVAEFVRSYITNPAYARKQAPNAAEAFERLVATSRPELAALLSDASRISQIESGLAPADVMRSMIVSGTKPSGFRKFAAERREFAKQGGALNGIVPTLGLWFDRFYGNVFGKDRWIKRYTDQLREAQFQKSGQPLPEFGWTDPYKSFRQLPGARQAAVDALYYGVRDYGKALDGAKSPALYDALSKAFGGHVTAINNPDDPLVKSFSAYLVARRSRALYERWANGDLKNPPVRASRNEVLASVAELEKAFPQFKEAADDVVAFSNAMWRKKFEAGLIPRDVYETVAGRGDDYVPFYRDMRDQAAGGRGTGTATLAQNQVKSIRGSTRDIIDPIHSIAFDTAQTERIIALNDTVKAIHRLAEQGGEFSGRFLERVPNTSMRAESLDLAEGLRNAARAAGVEKADAEVIIRHMEEMIGDDLTATIFRPAMETSRGERVMFYWDGGDRVALKVGDDETSKQFFDLFTGMSRSELDIMMAMFGRANALFSQLITNPPSFAIKNLIMDNISRIFIARNTGALGRIPGAAIAMGVHAQIFDREFARSYAALGGIRGGVASAAARELDEAKGLKAVAMRPKGLADMKAEVEHLLGNPKDLAIEVAKSPWHALELIRGAVESTETMGRLGQAKIVFRHLKKQGLSDEEAFRGAVYEARDILDYDRKGWATTGFNRFLPFFNAGLQGLDRSQRALFGAPLEAAVQSYRRGGYAALDEEAKTALSDAVKNWGVIAAGTVLTMGYYAWNADDPVYQRMSDYMRRRYFIFPAGSDKDGKTNVVTMPKPFDHAGAIFGAVENAMDGIRRGDPQTWSRVINALKDGFAPRQFGSVQEFLGSLPPSLKVPFEVLTGQKLGFDGGQSFPIIPQSVKALPPEMQYTGTTSALAKKMGQWFGISPVVTDHVLNGMGGTAVKDTNTLLTALVDDQPNVTPKDAMRQMFFGALYREQRGGGGFKSDLMEVMGRENGQYVTAAKGYLTAKEEGDQDQAAAIYTRGDDLAKTIMTIRAGPFKPDQRQLHPLERTAALGDIFSKITRDLAGAQVEKLDRSRKRGQERDYIDLQPTTARALTNTIGSLMAEEIRNGLTIAGQPGYQNYDVIDTKARYEAIRALSPEVAAEIKTRMDKAHILPAETVKRAWPELKQRLLKDRESARIVDLKHLN